MSTMLWADAQQGERFDKRIGKVIIGVFSPPVGPALVMMIKKIFTTDTLRFLTKCLERRPSITISVLP